jgi:hypothetical protein
MLEPLVLGVIISQVRADMWHHHIELLQTPQGLIISAQKVTTTLTPEKKDMPSHISGNFMNEFMRQNWFKIIIAVDVFIIALSIGYYFIFFVPQNEKIKEKQQAQEKYLEQQEKCKEAGLKAYKEDTLLYGVNNMIEPSYAYNKNLNVCLYSGGYNDYNLSSGQCGDTFKHYCDAFWERWVKNSFTNEKIIAVVNFTDEKGEYTAKTETLNEFWEKRKQLMGQ